MELRLGSWEGCIGVFDSGVGGISVLRSLVQELPNERFVYFGDSIHAPYGEKKPEEVLELSRSIVEGLLESGCKAIVIACNTATSAAAAQLRDEHPDVPIIGVEPALKPAVLAERHGKVLVMATPMTVRLKKFRRLLDTWGNEASVIAVPCDGLAARIEQGNLDAPDLMNLIEKLVGSYADAVDGVVLGCTHYPFVRRQIASVIGDVPFFDGSDGTARQLRRRLDECGLIAAQHERGSVEFLSSDSDSRKIEQYRWFFELPIE